MIELTWIPGALKGLFWVYVVLGIASLIAALMKPKTLLGKAGWTLVVLLAFGLLPFLAARGVREDKQVALAGQERLKAATAQFELRCKSAGEKINRTVENVEGVVWMKWRPKSSNDGDQFKLDDPYGKDCSEEGCIADLLRVTRGAELNPEEAARYTKGYRYVESADPSSGDYYRYAGTVKLRPRWTEETIAREKKLSGKEIGPTDHVFTVERQTIAKASARYGITWDDISTREDREHWIAGGSLKVIDLQTNEVIAEHVGYMMDRGLGSTSGFRSPWGDAPWSACPAFAKAPSGGPFMSYRTRDFVIQVLKPTKGD